MGRSAENGQHDKGITALMAQSCVQNDQPANTKASFAVRGGSRILRGSGPDRPRANWKSRVGRDLQKMGTRLGRSCSVSRQE